MALFAIQTLLFSHGFALECNPVGVVDEAVEYGICQGGIPDACMPLGNGELTRNDGASTSLAIVEQFKEVVSAGWGHRDQSPVIQQQHIELGQFRHEFGVRSVGTRHLYGVQEA